MKKTVFLFPGQGSQSVGMGSDFYSEYDGVRELFDMAEETVKLNLSRICFKGPEETLTETVNLQPALMVVNLAILYAINKAGLQADITAGHSLGEYSALAASQVVSQENAFRLVMKRGTLMQREAMRYKGAMHAIIGLDIEDVERIISKVKVAHGVVSIANHNMKQQIVITGVPEAVEPASEMARSLGARAVPLKVSGAWHSQLIKGAERDFRNYIETIPFNRPAISVIHNVTADVIDDPDKIRAAMIHQLCSPVRWYETMQALMDEKVEVFVEVGPGKVLSGLLRKTIPADYPPRIYSVNSMKTLELFLKTTL